MSIRGPTAPMLPKRRLLRFWPVVSCSPLNALVVLPAPASQTSRTQASKGYNSIKQSLKPNLSSKNYGNRTLLRVLGAKIRHRRKCGTRPNEETPDGGVATADRFYRMSAKSGQNIRTSQFFDEQARFRDKKQRPRKSRPLLDRLNLVSAYRPGIT